MLYILLVIIILHLIIKKFLLEHLKNHNNTNYYKMRNCIDDCKIKKCKDKKNKRKCYNINGKECSNQCLKKDTETKKQIMHKKVGCLISNEGIKLPLYKKNEDYYYLYDDEVINYDKIMKIKSKKKKRKRINKVYKKLIKNKDTKNLEELDVSKNVKSGSCKYTLRRDYNDVKIILGNKCKSKKKKCKSYV